jgi:hypothetical protein
MLGATLLGLSHVMGEEVVPTARLTLRVVLAVQVYCIERAAATAAQSMKLYFLNIAVYAVMNAMGLYRPNELSLCYLKGMWEHCLRRRSHASEKRALRAAHRYPFR